jgi:NAD(P)-dependent dehydrogenase (short-subunit alcohol dehydrogenase family)
LDAIVAPVSDHKVAFRVKRNAAAVAQLTRAAALAAEGAAVAVNYSKSAEAAEKVVAEIVAAGGKAKAWGADIGAFDSTKAMVDDIVAVFGSIDIVVNNAGVAQRAPGGGLDVVREAGREHRRVEHRVAVDAPHLVRPLVGAMDQPWTRAFMTTIRCHHSSGTA